MATTIEQQVAMDEALVPSTQREMLHICPRIHDQSFDELPFEEEILDFIRFLGHNATIRTLTDININKLYQPWNTKAYKECYAFATGEAVPKPKASFRRKRSDSDTSITPPATTTPKPTVAVTPRLTAAAKGKQTAKSLPAPSKPGGSGIDEGTGVDDKVKDKDDDKGDEGDESDEGEEDAGKDKDGDERDDDEKIKRLQSSKDEGDGEEDQGLNVNEEEHVEEEEEDELYRDVNINQARGLRATLEVKDTHVTLTLINSNGQQESSLVKGQVKEQVSKILPRIEQSVNAQLEAEVLTRSSHSSRTSYVVAAALSEMELKKFFIEKMEGNKFVQRSDEQRNLYKALVDAYEADKIILDSYGENVILKRRRDDDDDQDEGPFAGSDWGSKRRREGKEPESASAPLKTTTKSAGRSTTGSKPRQASARESAFVEEPVQTTSQIEEPSHPVFETGAEDQPIVQSSQHPEWFSQLKKPPTPDRDWNKTLPVVQGSTQTWISELAKQVDSRSSFNELLDTPLDFSNFIMNRLRVDILTPKLLVGPTFELMKGSCTSLIELEYHLEEVYKATMDQLDWVNPEVTKTKAADYEHIKWIEDLVPRTMWIQEPIDYDKHAFWGVSHWGCKRQQFYGFAVKPDSALDVYSKRRIIAVTDLKIVEWHSYKHLDWITVRRDDDKLYKFKEGDFKRLRLQDIKDMLLLLVQEKLTNLTIEERFAFNVSLRMFTRNIIIQRRVEDLQLGVKSYQKRLNLTNPDTYRSDLNDGTLNDVRTALDDCLKGIRIQYLPQKIWRKGDKDRAAAMIQAIDKMLKTRRIMRSLEKFVGGRLYEGDFRILQRTI
nr:hypothetical protein [Tanacetum cinerariifolium]